MHSAESNPRTTLRNNPVIEHANALLEAARAVDVESCIPTTAGRRAIELLDAAERLTAEAVRRLVPFDEAQGSIALGYASPVRHLAVEADRANAEGAALHAVVVHCRKHPITAKALEVGLLRIAHVEALARASRGLDDFYVEDEHQLISLAADRDVDAFTRQLGHWRNRRLHHHGEAEDDAARRFDQRRVTIQRGLDGSAKGSFELDPVAAEVLEEALHTKPDPIDGLVPPRSVAQRRADRLTDMAHHWLNNDPAEAPGFGVDHHDGSDARGARGTRTTVDVLVDLQTLEDRHPLDVASLRAEFDSGQPLSMPVLEQLLCGSAFRRLVMDGPSRVLDYSASSTDIPPALRRAVRRRSPTCDFPGCDRHWRWCDLHHLVPRSRGGRNSEANLANVCRFHHTLIHQGGWELISDPTTGVFSARSP